MPRAIWSGSISFGLVNIPVKLYSAVTAQDRALQPARRPHQRPRQAEAGRRPRPATRSRASRSSRATSCRPGPYVIITDDELAALDPKAVRTIDIDEFVDLDEIDPIFYDSAYYLAPDKASASPTPCWPRPWRRPARSASPAS